MKFGLEKEVLGRTFGAYFTKMLQSMKIAGSTD
jgi:hypothetical protein